MEFSSTRNQRQIRVPYQRTTPAQRPSSNACRRLSLTTPTFYSRTAATSSSNMFVPESPDRPYWRPGELLPNTGPTSFHDPSPRPETEVAELKSLLQGLQSSVETNFREIKEQLNSLEERVTKVEGKQEEFQTTHTSPASSSGQSDTRKRRSPPELQNLIRRIHNALEDDNQLHTDERIDSEHNRNVAGKIKEEIGTEKYTEIQIKDGVRIYRKTLREASKGRSGAVQARVRIRSRQQRLFETRAKEVKERERMHWKHVTPDMMSEEEENEDGFIRHRQSWRSQTLNRFIEKIDNRLSRKSGKSTARRREYGDLCERPTPKDVPNWMIVSTCSGGNIDNGTMSDELISSGDELPE